MKISDHTIYAPNRTPKFDKTSALSVPFVVDEQTRSGSDISLTNSAFTQFRTSNYTYIADKSNDEGVKTSNGNGLEEALYEGYAFELIDTAGVVKAHYEYSPFGKVVHKSGPLADKNPFQFSTKYLDNETQLYYYGLRYYNPESGRWINRDPIGEQGGTNIYGFINNTVINYFDYLGLRAKWTGWKRTGVSARMKGPVDGFMMVYSVYVTFKTTVYYEGLNGEFCAKIGIIKYKKIKSLSDRPYRTSLIPGSVPAPTNPVAAVGEIISIITEEKLSETVVIAYLKEATKNIKSPRPPSKSDYKGGGCSSCQSWELAVGDRDDMPLL